MDVPTTTGKTEAQSKGGRRSTRLNIAIPISISGKDSDGLSFKEDTRTAVINKHGAKFLTLHQLTLGDEVIIENRALGVSAKAKVVWLGKRRSPQDSVEVGIQLAEDKNVWGIAFPPEDWQEGSPVVASGGKLGVAAPVSRPPPAAPPAEAAPVPAPTPAKIEVASKPAPAALPPIAQLTAVMKGSLETFTRQAETIAEGHARLFQEQLSGLVRQVGTQAQVTLQESAAQLQDQATRALEEKLQPIEERLLSSRKEIEAQLSQLSESLVCDFEDHLQESRDREVLEASEHLHKAADNLKGLIAKDFHEQGLEAGKALKDDLKASWKGLAEDARRQLLNLATHTAESMNTEAGAGLEEFRHQLQKSVKDLQDKSAEELENHLKELGKRQCEELIHGLHRDAEESGERATAQFKSAIENAVREASDALDKHVGSGAVFLKQLEDQAKVQLETHAQMIEEAGRRSAEAFSKQLEGLAGSRLDKLGQELEALLDRHRKELEEVTKTHQNKAMEEVQAKLQYVTERLTEDSAAQLTTLTKENLEMAVFKLQESKDNIVNEAEEAFRARLPEVIAPALKPSDRKSKPKESPEPEKGRNKG